VLPALLDRGAVKRPGRGRPRRRPDRLAGDKGYASRKARRELRRRGIGPVIPTKANERRNGRFDRAAYRERNAVERLINRLKQHRAPGQLHFNAVDFSAFPYRSTAWIDESHALIG